MKKIFIAFLLISCSILLGANTQNSPSKYEPWDGVSALTWYAPEGNAWGYDTYVTYQGNEFAALVEVSNASLPPSTPTSNGQWKYLGSSNNNNNPNPKALNVISEVLNGTVNNSFTQILSNYVSGGLPPYTFTLESSPKYGTCSIVGNQLNYTPTSSGTETISYLVTDSAKNSITGSLTINISTSGSSQPQGSYPAYNPANAYVGGSTVSENGLNYKANWYVNPGQDPASNSGGPGSGQPWTQISGTPSVQPTIPLETSQGVQFSINTTGSITQSLVNYVSGGVPPYTFTLESSPKYGTCSILGNQLNYTPTSAGTETISYLVRDSAKNSATGSLTINISSSGSSQPQGSYPAYNPANAYVGGSTVSENGLNYKANWYVNPGQDPASNSGGPGSGQPWTQISGTPSVQPTTSLSINTNVQISVNTGGSITQDLTNYVSGGKSPYIVSNNAGTTSLGGAWYIKSNTLYYTAGSKAGNDTINYSVTDSSNPAKSANGKITITVNAVTPQVTLTASALSQSVLSGASFSQNLTAGIVGGSKYTVAAVSASTLGSAIVMNGNTMTYTAGTKAGQDIITYTVYDVSGAKVSDSITVTVTQITPTLKTIPQNLSSVVGTSFSYNLNQVVQGGSAPYNFTITGSSPISATLNNSSIITFTPEATGTETISYTVTDSSSPSQTQNGQLTINVTEVTPQTSSLWPSKAMVGYVDLTAPGACALITKKMVQNYNVIIFSFISSSGTFKLGTDSGDVYKEYIDIIKGMEKTGTLNLVSIGGACGNIQDTNYEDPNFLANVVKTVNDYNFDGVDIDAEQCGTASVILNFAANLRDQLGNNKILTIAPVYSNSLGLARPADGGGISYGFTTKNTACFNAILVQNYNGDKDQTNSISSTFNAIERSGVINQNCKIVIGLPANCLSAKYDNLWAGDSTSSDSSIANKIVTETTNLDNNKQFGGLMVWSLNTDADPSAYKTPNNESNPETGFFSTNVAGPYLYPQK